MELDNKKEKSKQAYEKPRLRTIELSAEEVMAIGCKTSFGDPAGVAGNGCTTGVCSSQTGS
jgi:hypothetical protein